MVDTQCRECVTICAAMFLLPQGNFECAPTVLAEQTAACTHLQDGQLLLDGFVLFRSKQTFGPAQQAFILMRSLKSLEGCRDVREFVLSGERHR